MIGGELLKNVAINAGLKSELVGDTSVDVCLGFAAKSPKSEIYKVNAKTDKNGSFVTLPGSPVLVFPRRFVVTRTEEFIQMPKGFSAMFSLRSKFAQLGLEQATSVFIRPGWEGYLVLELFNFADWIIELTPGEPIGQLHFFRVDDGRPS